MKNKIFLFLAGIFILAVVVLIFKIETADVDMNDIKHKDLLEAESNKEILGETDEQQRAEERLNEEIDEYIKTMTLEEKVAQLFIVLPESLIKDVNLVTAAGTRTKEAMNEIPVGGFIYMSNNLQSEEQVSEMLRNTQTYSMECTGVPVFLCVDEEGGTVSRISGTGKFDVPQIENMSVIGETRDEEKAYETGEAIGKYLSRMGFNVDFAPVADVLSNSENNVVKLRSFGTDPANVTKMAMAVSNGLQSQGIYSSYKHFPGHGSTSGDTHEGYAYTEKTLEELMECELIPFQSGIDNDVPFIMVGHISAPNITGDHTPASLSKYMVQDVLRGKMGYDGIVITDAMNMGAIVQQYSSADAAVKALQAGVDIILMPEDFHKAYYGVIDAVQDGGLSEERVNESLKRILRIKLQME